MIVSILFILFGIALTGYVIAGFKNLVSTTEWELGGAGFLMLAMMSIITGVMLFLKELMI